MREEGTGCGAQRRIHTVHYTSIHSTDKQDRMTCAMITKKHVLPTSLFPFQSHLYTGSMSVLGVEIPICSIKVSLRKRTRW